ncbi:MAG: hypothetical protein B6D69_07470 [gamma proteobacterium symbiont of Stewartia floridana]|nr:MAG: hypothetical protein B6D69_07470 [gamma proteobacterium symbiont of Stewartia floridana]RLW53637.1 MAG: hypothetical protein B6D76_10895 [gamma proteobacterium symbiont of Stewartia floridana]RLW60577.1 MAG: hypothetical protein B6D75_05925 [gamma proteobacterium symbiont of Stewartia floridana]
MAVTAVPYALNESFDTLFFNFSRGLIVRDCLYNLFNAMLPDHEKIILLNNSVVDSVTIWLSATPD